LGGKADAVSNLLIVKGKKREKNKILLQKKRRAMAPGVGVPQKGGKLDCDSSSQKEKKPYCRDCAEAKSFRRQSSEKKKKVNSNFIEKCQEFVGKHDRRVAFFESG